MASCEEIIQELDTLTPESLDEVAHYVRYLRWKQTYGDDGQALGI
jgi:hypothetical protein